MKRCHLCWLGLQLLSPAPHAAVAADTQKTWLHLHERAATADEGFAPTTVLRVIRFIKVLYINNEDCKDPTRVDGLCARLGLQGCDADVATYGCQLLLQQDRAGVNRR